MRAERPDYPYLKGVFRTLRVEVEVPKSEHRLLEVPTEGELRQFYRIIWQTRNFADMILIKTMFYTGVRVSELMNIRLLDVDVERCQIRINQGKGNKDRQVPFPISFRELLALHMRPFQIGGKSVGWFTIHTVHPDPHSIILPPDRQGTA